MTLNTAVFLRGDISPRHAFETAISAVLTAAGREGEAAKIDSPCDWGDGVLAMCTSRGQGLPAWTWCYYRDDGPLAASDQRPEDPEDGDYLVRPACSVEISWDTAYSYSDNGLTCTQLHVLALVELRRALPEHVSMSWRNEYSGEINTELEGFEEFLGSGTAAMGWFQNVALPAIMSEHHR